MMIYPPFLEEHSAMYQHVRNWEEKKERELLRFTSVEQASRYVRQWSLLERMLAVFCFEDSTARYSAAKEYLWMNRDRETTRQ
ncbi:hypothetical protein JW826_01120 [Candidatus Woesearchaeota archaeon]|nr:hypothetical protein [Candidatus Woesearchaeota archaeon]